jgi:hypothetical protein
MSNVARESDEAVALLMLVMKLILCAAIGWGCWWVWDSGHPAVALALLAYLAME